MDDVFVRVLAKEDDAHSLLHSSEVANVKSRELCEHERKNGAGEDIDEPGVRGRVDGVNRKTILVGSVLIDTVAVVRRY